MSDKTGIEWTEATWNPVTGCTKVSVGCANCYAERWAKRTFKGRPFSEVRCHPERLDQPLQWRKPRRVFVASMGDLFHERIPDDFIDGVFNVMGESERHTFQVLTKRPKRMLAWFRSRPEYPLFSHIWLGVSVENQKTADERIPVLLQTPAAVRFVSIEPMIAPVNVIPYLRGWKKEWDAGGDIFTRTWPAKLDWVVVGGETGPKARPVHPDSVRSVHDQCHAQGVRFFFKGWGEYQYQDTTAIDGQWHKFRVGKKRAGRMLGGRTWDEMPEVNSAWGSSDK